MNKPKRKRISKVAKVVIVPLNDGTNTPVPNHENSKVISPEEAALYKQAGNTLGDPNKI